MINFSIQEIAFIIGGEVYKPEGFEATPVEQIITDSRHSFRKGSTLFFALKGQRNNGHAWVPALIERGLTSFVVSEPDAITNEAAFILVDDTTLALQKLAAGYRNRFRYPVVGITGSNGKTIVKEWLYQLLMAEKKIVRSPKSYNSQIGVPLSVLLMESHNDLALFEAGISMPGEMEKLEPVIRPTVGILTNIGDAHQENFSSREEKIHEKLKLFTASQKLVFCSDDKRTGNHAKRFCSANNTEPVSWSLWDTTSKIHFKPSKKDEFTQIDATVSNHTYRFEIPFTDASSIENACHCFAAVYALGIDPRKVMPGFHSLEPVAMRLEIKKGINNCLLINDYYNSDLASLSIAISALHQQAKKGNGKMQIILSDIRQTGAPMHKLYRQVNQLLNQWEIDELTGIGPEISSHAGIFTTKKSFFPSTEAFLKAFNRNSFNESSILIKGARDFAFERISAVLQQKAHQTILEIDMNALVHNLNVYRSLLMPSTKMMIMVKAFSYGSGDVEIARMLQFHNVDYLAVAVADEGIELRQAGIYIPIIVMNPEEQSFQNMIDYQLEPNIYNLSLLQKFERAVIQNARTQIPIHIKLDTGMNRLGLKSEKEVDTLADYLTENNNLTVKSVFSHLVGSDDHSFDAFTKEQIDKFKKLSDHLISHIGYSIDCHILNSAGIERFPEYQMNMVRLGIGLYGVSATALPLKHISTFRSVVSQVKTAMPGETVGYSRKGTINRETQVAIIPVGYADGLDRKLGNRNGEAWINGKKVPIIGNICMDMLMLDVTGVDTKPGDAVEFFGRNIPVTEVASRAGTIPYEILTGISQRVKRVYLYE